MLWESRCFSAIRRWTHRVHSRQYDTICPMPKTPSGHQCKKFATVRIFGTSKIQMQNGRIFAIRGIRCIFAPQDTGYCDTAPQDTGYWDTGTCMKMFFWKRCENSGNKKMWKNWQQVTVFDIAYRRARKIAANPAKSASQPPWIKGTSTQTLIWADGVAQSLPFSFRLQNYPLDSR